MVKIQKRESSILKQPLWCIGAYQIFGDMEVIEKTKRKFRAVVRRNNTEAYWISSKQFLSCLNHYKQFKQDIMSWYHNRKNWLKNRMKKTKSLLKAHQKIKSRMDDVNFFSPKIIPEASKESKIIIVLIYSPEKKFEKKNENVFS